jgi:hypothetical protein
VFLGARSAFPALLPLGGGGKPLPALNSALECGRDTVFRHQFSFEGAALAATPSQAKQQRRRWAPVAAMAFCGVSIVLRPNRPFRLKL